MPFDQANRSLPAIARTMAEEFGAHSILAGDDVVFWALAQLVRRLDGLDLSPATRAMIARSMPNSASAALLSVDSDFIVAEQNARLCPAPPCVANPSETGAEQFADEVGFPVVVKFDGFASGHGVRLCNDRRQLLAALAARPEHPRHAKFVVQKFVRGEVFGVTACGLQGKPLAGFSFVKHRCTSKNGATSVARHAPRRDILDRSFELFGKYGLNGYAGFDYIVDEAGQPFLIEVNPRLMPTGHFSDEFGVDLTATLLAEMRRKPAPKATAPKHEYVALFPNEWLRDPQSTYLRSAYHDVPQDDPAVAAAMMQDARKWRAQAARVQRSREVDEH
ncbi:MAG: ATP-grasp domain-containing protein [Hyphomonadaceae bacterium]